MAKIRAAKQRAGGLERDLLIPGLLHEIRHPLMGIRAGLQLLAAQLDAAVTRSDDWKLIVDQLARLEETLSSYQALVEAGRAGLRFEAEPVVRRAVSLLAFRTRRLGDRFAMGTEPGLFARGNPQSLLHATTNVLWNALDAVEDLPGARVQLRVLAAAPSVEVRISDEGAGIPGQLVRKVMKGGFTTKPNGKGLGLHIARGALTRSGGELWLAGRSDPLRLPWASTEFVIALPAA